VNILVAIKSVPDPNALRFDSAGNFAASTPRVVNEYDSYAIEEAILIKESGHDAEITVVSVGPASAKDAVTRALAMGADKGVLIVSDEASADAWKIAAILAEHARSGSYDLIFVGQESSDGGTGNVGPYLAGVLDLPLISNVVGLEIGEGGVLHLQREIEDGRQMVQVTPPAVICALTGLNEPRFPSLKGIMAARRKPIEESPVASYVAPASSTTWGGLRSEERKVEGTIITSDPETAAKQVVELLRERNLL
jgi:electron transfer flavoprotein beta subunit